MHRYISAGVTIFNFTYTLFYVYISIFLRPSPYLTISIYNISLVLPLHPHHYFRLPHNLYLLSISISTSQILKGEAGRRCAFSFLKGIRLFNIAKQVEQRKTTAYYDPRHCSASRQKNGPKRIGFRIHESRLPSPAKFSLRWINELDF